MAEGKTSFELWLALTSSLGWTLAPSFSPARLASTSFMFMFDEVPEPVWYTSTGNWSSHWPAATSSAAAAMASATFLSTTLSRALTTAAPPLMLASAAMRARSMWRPEIGKLSTARWVCAAHLAEAGTRTSPMVSCSMRYSSLMVRTVVPVPFGAATDGRDPHAPCRR
jgi:hypothetical protein